MNINSFFKNRAVITLTLANVFEVLGISIFNIVILTYAKDFPNANLFVSIASVASIFPGILGLILGRLADNTRKKSAALIRIKIYQAFIYILLANIITAKTTNIFFLVILINITSDILGMYSNNLQAPIVQKRVPSNLQRTTLGISQSVSMLVQPIGQSIGVVTLSLWHSYAIAGYINAIAFILSAIVLYLGKSSIKLSSKFSSKSNKRKKSFLSIFKQIFKTLRTASGVNVPLLLISIMLANTLTAGFSVINNLFLLDHPNVSGLPYSVSVLCVSIANIIGAIIGSLFHTRLTDKITLQRLISFEIICLVVLFINLWVFHYFLLILIPYFLLGWSIGQFNPKLDSEILKISDPNIIGSVFGAITSIATVASPIGSVGLVLIYNLFPTWITFSIVISILLVQFIFTTSNSMISPKKI
ncbi:MFS transporter [Pediococcus claussenii]|uniref:Major Facilitator Superfamily protein n=1 Tax=Pediococcus claussenii (strain ATCC BAA-344 / DSM 14800 / JCM 18046 / KCTC 3811 / LMG 21948 / P06) TaxID=701521 RepID=G8PBA4_PEDCP|nr:MFS transporter [Pediococcus claussenii]AEV95893.1 major Facilitator Superfamily protein [Pediococcus claussenii ATCC BAA-344]ANZ69387.1 hypothetical protein AYR57_03285 [Pediococcus claussenii]ANZ71207.1 hypothetical protein AYR58_03300 [Pediococcus claussenii]KRN20500.1 hypothetical protein IV79_GL000555 [Pediococcus claussenii]